MNDEPTPAQKLAALHNTLRLRGERPATTYHQLANADLEDQGGRFAAERSSSPTYPSQPPESPWSGDPSRIEPALGIDVNALDPVGEAFEIEQSLRGTTPVASGEAAVAPSVSFPSDVVATPAPKLRRL
jgi:hypothetical protein